jgi:hypothetical protein
VTKICDSRFPASGSPIEEIAVECQLPLRRHRALPGIAPLVLLLPMIRPVRLPLPIDADAPAGASPHVVWAQPVGGLLMPAALPEVPLWVDATELIFRE